MHFLKTTAPASGCPALMVFWPRAELAAIDIRASTSIEIGFNFFFLIGSQLTVAALAAALVMKAEVSKNSYWLASLSVDLSTRFCSPRDDHNPFIKQQSKQTNFIDIYPH